MEDYNKNGRKKWYFSWWGICIIAFAILFLSTTIAFALSVITMIKNEPPDQAAGTRQLGAEALALISGTGKNYWLGAAGPKITIVEFADFSCPQCQKSYPKIREIGIKYKNEVKIIFRDFPVVSEQSLELAHSARCAGEQGLFWPMHDKLFVNQGAAAGEIMIKEMARQIGANLDKFNACMDNEKYLPDIKKDFDDAQKLGVFGTPTWFINGRMVEGDIPYNAFIEIIEDLLKK